MKRSGRLSNCISNETRLTTNFAIVYSRLTDSELNKLPQQTAGRNGNLGLAALNDFAEAAMKSECVSWRRQLTQRIADTKHSP